MVVIELVEPDRPSWAASRVELPADGRRLGFERQAGHLVLVPARWNVPAGSLGIVDGVGQVVAQYREQIVLKGGDPKGVSSEYLVDGDEFAIGRTTLRVESRRSVDCPACRAPLRARPLHGFGFPIDRCEACLTISRNRPERASEVIVEGAFVRRLMARLERAAQDGTLDATLLEIRSDPELRPVLDLPDLARLVRARR